MLVVTGIIQIAEDSIETAKELAIAMSAATRAEAGCHAYAFYQDIEDPTRVRLYEEWEDQAALDAHFQTPHMAAYIKGLEKLDILSSNVVKFERGDASPVV